MARRRKGRAVHGWLIVDKPAGLTSTAVVGKVRWALDARKAGHAGTLDPDATGLLAVALGEATKTIPLLAEATKGYDFRVTWGAETTTDDAAGTVTATSRGRPDRAAIEAALPAFRGDIAQVPPQVSAVHVDGRRAYDVVRDGTAVDLALRPLHVASLEVLEVGPDWADLRMACGKGGYVRSIARDLGRALGCLGHVAWLRRTWSGPFRAEHGVALDTVERLARTPDLDALLRPLEVALGGLPELPCTPEGATRLRHGNPGAVTRGVAEGTEAWASEDGRAVALGTYRGGSLHPSRVFVRDEGDVVAPG
ncbi:tRNA pseudouridine(55) synthase TruB [Jannaschia sp. LMIT008]|uniref:tRNA pseudouridine(55) synthase TruB n=1 Tax=Jannaschia maritima TaxID=3032585 RepID=UPI0028119EA8|nr:tRNA pseudouridine(55) synthase TruB [Jannaschia sp. LMIT008]